ncbi:hypothetical protein ACOMHN_013442 [Nucella lapillus]
MDGGQVYRVSLSEGVYGSWRAIGELEGLPSDGDIAQFLVTLYCSSGQQREGGECVLRCGHCRCPLSLSCSACHPPPSPHPHLPPHPSLTSPPPHSPSLTSPPPPPSLTVPLPPFLDTTSPPLCGDALHSPVLESEKLEAYISTEKGDAGSAQDDGEFDFDDCPVDFGAVKADSPFCVYHEDEPCTSETVPPTVSWKTRSSVRRRKHETSSLKKYVVRSRGEGRKRRTAGSVNSYTTRSKRRKVVKKNQCPDKDLLMDCSQIGAEKKRQNNGVQKRDLALRASHEELRDKDDARGKTEENIDKEQRKGKVFESDSLGAGFVIPAEERRSAEIHMFDDSFFTQHRVENKVAKHVKQKPSSNADKSLKTFDGEDINEKQEILETHRAEDVVSGPKMKSSPESFSGDEIARPPLRILVSGQKIPPIKTADGSYTRSLYTHFECLFCRKAFSHKRSFNKHIQTHVEETLYKCLLCNKGFESLYSLTEHEKKHKLECEVCGKKCTEKNEYNSHMKLHTENNGVMKCPGCSYQSTDFYVYRKHKYECAYLRPALQCEICGVHLKSAKSLKHHIAAIHRNDRPYKCSLCEKSFVFKTKLNCHMKYNHAEGGRLFHCDKCGHRFIDPKGLKSHQRSVHSSEKPFKCSHCPSAFARKYTLGVHMRLHTGEKPFRCTECLQAFVQKPSLLLHLKSHHGQKTTASKVQVQPEHGP